MALKLMCRLSFFIYSTKVMKRIGYLFFQETIFLNFNILQKLLYLFVVAVVIVWSHN